MFLLLPIIITIALMAGAFLLALVSDAFANELSRGVEAAFDFVEYRTALRRARQAAHMPSAGHSVYESLYTHTA